MNTPHLQLGDSSTRGISHVSGYNPHGGCEYRKQLKRGDTVLIQMEAMIGEEEGIVVANDDKRIVVQLSRNSGKLRFRSFWVKNGRSCGPASTNDDWGTPWLFFFIVTPWIFQQKIFQIVNLSPQDTIILPAWERIERKKIPF